MLLDLSYYESLLYPVLPVDTSVGAIVLSQLPEFSLDISLVSSPAVNLLASNVVLLIPDIPPIVDWPSFGKAIFLKFENDTTTLVMLSKVLFAMDALRTSSTPKPVYS